MKKVVLSVAIVALGFSATSCKKYTCSCYDNSTGASSTKTVSARSTVDAALKCSQQSNGSVTCSY